MYFAWIYFHEHEKPKYFVWINSGENSINSRNFIHAKFVRLNNAIRERSLTLFEKQLPYLIQTDRGAVLKLNNFFLLG